MSVDLRALQRQLAPFQPVPTSSGMHEDPTSEDGRVTERQPQGRIVLCVPGRVSITETASKLYGAPELRGRLYIRGGVVVEIEVDPAGGVRVSPLSPSAARSRLEQGVDWVRHTRDGDIPTVLTEQDAKALLDARERNLLPALQTVLDASILVERSGQLVCLNPGYDPDEQAWVNGSTPPEDVSLEEATRAIFEELLADFQFATRADKARAIVALLSPALVAGNLMHGRCGLCVVEANASQTGKGYMIKVFSVVYGQRPICITKVQRGVGSLDESLDQALIWGRPIISLDNIRGAIDSQKLESLLTEPTYMARVPYSRSVLIDPRRFTLFMTSNGAEMTQDLANRSLFIRLRKRERHEFRRFPEGGLLEHVAARQPFFHGCVNAVIRAWHSQGKPRSSETRHSMRDWIQIGDWIVQSLFGMCSVLEGHEAVQDRSARKFLGFVRQLAITVERAARLEQWLRCHQLYNIALEHGLEIPCVPNGSAFDDKLGARGIGIALGSALGGRDAIEVDEFKMIRDELEPDEVSHHAHRVYMFSKKAVDVS